MSNFDWSNSTLSGVKGSDLNLVRTSPHINRWESDGNGSLIIKAREDSDTYSRSTTHFTLNSTVQDHSSGTFSGGKYAVISPLSTAADNNIVSGIGTVDTWMLPTDGKITLPGATLFAPEGEELPERLKGVNTIRYTPDDDITKNYANLSSAIDTELKQKGVPTFDVGAYGWQGVSQPTKEEISNISSLVGSSIDLPSIHFGSPDETMESLISDVLKLKQYTIKDDFDSSEKSPMQQLDELKGRLSDDVRDVHEKAKGMYQEKFNKAYDSTKIEVEKWRDKHYPQESVSKLPEGFPLPNGSSTAIPPPMSSSVIPLTPSGNVPGMPPLPGTSIPPPIPTNMPVDTPLDMLGKSSEWTPSKTKLPYEQQLLRNIADLQKEVQPDHHSVDGILKEGLFGGTNNKLNVDSNGNVVLTRFASDEQHLTKNWVNVGQKELLETSLFHGGGKGLPTSGFANWSFGLSDFNKTVGNFVIPSKDFLQGIRDKNIYLGNLGEGEFVLNPNWAKDYLSSINDKKVTVDKSGSIRYEGSSSISDTPPEFHGKSSEFLPNELKSKLKALEPNLLNGYVLDAYREGAPYNKVIRMAEENSVKNFFSSEIKIKSFDTETTGLNTTHQQLSKRDRIWQVGLAIEGIGGVEEHTNPFFTSNNEGKLEQSVKMSRPYLESSLKHSNGRFSKKAFEDGNFNQFMSMYEKGELSSLENSLNNTLGSINLNDVVVLQNMNFENQMLKSSLDQGLISKEHYESIAKRMETVSVDLEGNTQTLFQRPHKVQKLMRQADMMYHTEYLNNLSEDSFQQYRSTVNNAIAEYTSSINNKNRVGAVAVELQDLSKAFLANAANRGLIDKQTATLGLNVDFLSRAILGTSEKHTALKDSEDTISLFKKMWEMNSDLNSGAELSENTLKVLNNIKEQQPEEINKRFISTVRSVINDFKEKNYTKIGDNLTWYNPEISLRRQVNDGSVIEKLDKISVSQKEKEYNLPKALDNVISRYNKYTDNIGGFDRKNYVNNIVNDFNSGASFQGIHTKVDNDYFNLKTEPTSSTESIINKEINNSMNNSDNFWSKKTELFGKEMKMKTKATILGGIGAGLATMAFTQRPHPQDERYSNVSEQFYDEQYLGTAFVDFKERNKHYMM